MCLVSWEGRILLESFPWRTTLSVFRLQHAVQWSETAISIGLISPIDSPTASCMNVRLNVGPNSELLMLRSIKRLTPTPDDRNHVWRKFLWNWPRERVHNRVRGCSHDTGATFLSTRAHSSSLSWFCICLHDATTKCHTRASHTGVSSHRFPTISCKRDTTTRFGVKSVPCAG